MKLKKAISIILTIAMVISLVPGMAPSANAVVATILLSNATAVRDGNTGKINFTSNSDATIYYTVVDSGSPRPNIDTIGNGTEIISGQNEIDIPNLTGSKDVYLIAINDGPSNTLKVSFNDGWNYLGAKGFSSFYYDAHMATDSKGNTYAAVSDTSKNDKTTVYKFDGKTWNTLGTPGFTDGAPTSIMITCDKNDVPYIAFSDYDESPVNSGKVSVMKYSDGSWSYVGSRQFSSTAAEGVFLKFDSNNNPYVMYQNLEYNSSISDFQYKLSVAEYTNGAWNVLGGTYAAGEAGWADSISFNFSLALDSSDVPYIAYPDQTSGSKLTVKKFADGSWSVVGTAGFSASEAGFAQIFANGSDLYVGYNNINATASTPVVQKWDGSAWSVLGDTSSYTGSDYMIMAMNGSDIYIAYCDTANGNKIKVITYNGTSWSTLGPDFATSEKGYAMSMAVGSDGKPHILYCDGTEDFNISVISYNKNISVKSLPTIIALVTYRSETDSRLYIYSGESGSYYYKAVEHGAPAPEIDTSGTGTACTSDIDMLNISNLTANEQDLYVVVKNATGEISEPVKIDIPKYSDLFVNPSYTSSTPGWGVTDFATIQSAVDAAFPGATINVYAGTYNETPEINKELTLKGDNRNSIICSEGSNDSIVTISYANVTFTGFTIKAPDDTSYFSSGITLGAVTGCNITNNKISSGDMGIGVLLSSSNNISGNDIEHCQAYGILLIDPYEMGSSLENGQSEIADDSVLSNFENSAENIIQSRDTSKSVFGKSEYSDNDISHSMVVDDPEIPGLPVIPESTNNNIVRGNTVSDTLGGILLGPNCNSNVIDHNVIAGITEDSAPVDKDSDSALGDPSYLASGILFLISNSNKVYGNTVTNSIFGISCLGSGMNKVCGNNLSGNASGLFLAYDADYTDAAYSSISTDTISKNNIYGNLEYNVYADVGTDPADKTVTLNNNYWGETYGEDLFNKADGSKLVIDNHSSTKFYEVSFDTNSDAAAPDSDWFASGSKLGTLPTATRDGYPFNGWYTGKNGSGTHYTSDSIMPENALYLYANWNSTSPVYGGGSSASSSASNYNASVKVDGKTFPAGTLKNDIQNGKSEEIVTIDSQKLSEALSGFDSGVTVTVPFTGDSSASKGKLSGQAIKELNDKNAAVTFDKGSASCTLPPSLIDIDAAAKDLGANISDITFEVSISAPSDNVTKTISDASSSQGVTTAASPVEFSVTYEGGGKTKQITAFDSYVEKTIAIPDGTDASKITTAAAVDADGSLRHVPTEIEQKGGKYYAKIKSMTNDTYTLICNHVAYADVENHWSKDIVDNMGSRMVITGVGDNKFEPDRDITRGEFTAIIVRALGLVPVTGSNDFSDVSSSDWDSKFIGTAFESGIINGYGDGTFHAGDKITREQAMAMISRAMKITGLNVKDDASVLSGFADSASIADFAKAGAEACVETGVVSGRAADTLAPKDNITRAEVAVITHNLLEKSNLID
ncbi:MAG: S-layer homology domain-containing protein [Bacillota bacterium]|nr:S-layer homology domain-containing protein [Bacillota bacterium]